MGAGGSGHAPKPASDGFGKALERYAAAGIDELALSIAAAPEQQVRVVEQLPRARAPVATHGRRSGQ